MLAHKMATLGQVAKTRAHLDKALAIHKGHLTGAIPTTKASQEALMRQIQKARSIDWLNPGGGMKKTPATAPRRPTTTMPQPKKEGPVPQVKKQIESIQQAMKRIRGG